MIITLYNLKSIPSFKNESLIWNPDVIRLVIEIIFMSAFSFKYFLQCFAIPEVLPVPVQDLIKIVLLLFVFVWVRAAIPRYRYDQLMRLGWKVFLPLSILMIVLVSTWVVFFE